MKVRPIFQWVKENMFFSRFREKRDRSARRSGLITATDRRGS